MGVPGSHVSVIVVSDDWFARSMLQRAAEDAHAFSEIIAVDDGYSALAAVWDAVASGQRPTVIVIDQHSVGESTAVLVADLRGDHRTRSIYIAALVPEDVEPSPALNFTSACSPLHPDLSFVFRAIAAAAESVLAAGDSSQRV